MESCVLPHYHRQTDRTGAFPLTCDICDALIMKDGVRRVELSAELPDDLLKNQEIWTRYWRTDTFGGEGLVRDSQEIAIPDNEEFIEVREWVRKQAGAPNDAREFRIRGTEGINCPVLEQSVSMKVNIAWNDERPAAVASLASVSHSCNNAWSFLHPARYDMCRDCFNQLSASPVDT